MTAISVGRTRDAALIKKIVCDPQTYPYISDDLSPAPEDYIPPIVEDVYWVFVCRDEKRPVGLFLFIPVNGITLDVHSIVVPWARGTKWSLYAGASVLAWVWTNTHAERVITSCPAFNKRAVTYAQALGLKEFGVNPKSYLKNGELHDIIMLGVSRPAKFKEEKCQ